MKDNHTVASTRETSDQGALTGKIFDNRQETGSTKKTGTRIFVISDLHLGGVKPYMMSQPTRLEEFIDQLSNKLTANERLELVIAGDFIDFLAVPKFKSWTPEPLEAQNKLQDTLKGPFKPVFAALGRHIGNGHHLTILIGNHDLELALPIVQRAFLAKIEGNAQQVAFIADGSPYQIGGVLIEHGNRYDGANGNDWNRLRTIRSAQSRNEDPPVSLRVSAGSVIVEKVVNAIKADYPFIDLLQPQDKLLVYLLLSLEPTLLRPNISNIGHILKASLREWGNSDGSQPTRTYQVATEVKSETNPMLQSKLRTAFGADFDSLEYPRNQVSASDWLTIVKQVFKDGLKQIVQNGRAIPRQRLEQMRLVLAGWADDKLFDLDGNAGTYGKAAERMVRSGAAEVVVMGHTHLPRRIGPKERASYINTGTWADVIGVPADALTETDTALEKLEAFLRGICLDQDVRRFNPTYADIHVTDDGKVVHARLEVSI